MNPITFYHGSVRPENAPITIGSSDIPVIIKTRRTSIKKSQRDLWLEKRKMVEGFQGNERTELGHELEPIILAREIKRLTDEDTAYKFKVDAILHQDYRSDTYTPPTDFYPYTEAVHPKFPWAIAHADGLWVTEGIIFEGKAGGYWARAKRDGYDGFDLDKNSELEDPDKIPIEVMLQVQWQMLCYGLNLTYVLLFVDYQMYRFEIPAFKKWWPIMIEKASRFYNCCITGEMPPPEKKEDVFDMFPDIKDNAVYEIGDRALIAEDMKARRNRNKKWIKRLQSENKDIDNGVILLMQGSKFMYNGETSQKIFSQSRYMKENMMSPKELDEADYKKYKDLGKITESEVRRVN